MSVSGKVNELNVERNMDLVRVHALFHPLIGYCASLAMGDAS